MKCVYMLRDSNNLYKIGETMDVKARLRHIKHDSPFELIHTIVSQTAWWAEHWLHRRFAHARVHGEWFALTEEEVQWTRSIIELEVSHSLQLKHKAHR